VNTNALKKFATEARRRLIEQVGTKLEYVLNIDTAELREKAKQIRELQRQIDASSKHSVIERVAYTWFNRFMALRFMDAKGYTTVRAVSPVEGHTLPEILAEAKRGIIEADLKADQHKINDLLDGRIDSQDPQTEVYKLLLVAVCNSYNAVMPFMFEAISDYTELLMPDDLLAEGSILSEFVTNMTDEDCRNVEVVGWLYQFYISEKKDEVMARKKAVPKEDIPSVTQLFTPHWIVRYLVENSLGRLWMLNLPNSRLIDRMDYYIAPEEKETDFLRISSPEEIKICDPACGSGHMLVYAFDLLYAIYEEEGYDPPEIPRLILEKNLYGIEIDERAGELAAFALFMKAREKYRRFFKNSVQPNICVLENIKFEDEELEKYMDKIGRDLFTANLQETLHQFEEADNFGSLIRPTTTNITHIYQVLGSKNIAGELFLHGVHKRVLNALKPTDYLSPKYHVIVTNPPYLNTKGMNPLLKAFLQNNYKNVKSDLFSAFIVRCSELSMSNGHIGIMSPNVWMYILSHEKLRAILTKNMTLTNLVELPLTGFKGATVQICAFNFIKVSNPNLRGGFIRLVEFKGGDKEMGEYTQQAIQNPDCGWFFRASAGGFNKIPGSPIVYWATNQILDIFQNSKALLEKIETREGLTTGSNDLFLRRWPEVSVSNIEYDGKNNEYAKCSGKRWFPYVKGGEFRRWSGNFEYIVNWFNDGEELRIFKDPTTGRVRSHNYNGDYAFRTGFTWSGISSGTFAVRHVPARFMFDAKGPMGFSLEADEQAVHEGFLNSVVTNHLISMLAPTLDFKLGHILNLPLTTSVVPREVKALNQKAVKISYKDWIEKETSWNFTSCSLLPPNYCHPTLKETYTQLWTHWQEMTLEMQRLEEENNRIFIEAYGLRDELTPDVPLKEITLTCNPHYRYGGKKTEEELEVLLLADTMREFISYAVGCMLGRYSLDKPGLILSNQGETLEDYLKQVCNPTFMPDDDNVIPVLDDEYFTDDIVGRFKKFLRLTFGDDHYDENLAFIESAIGKDIRKYFLNDFYNHHVKIYKKRPIYWMFSSPKKSFNVLIYMHRYRSDTVSRILNEYLREFQEKLRARKINQQEISISESASASEKSRANREIARIDKVLTELDDYERNVLFPLATKKREIDLDDGVKVNYNKFGPALRAIPGLSQK